MTSTPITPTIIVKEIKDIVLRPIRNPYMGFEKNKTSVTNLYGYKIIDIVHEDSITYKSYRYTIIPTGTVLLKSQHGLGFTQLQDTAKCAWVNEIGNHKSLSRFCTCGFHAYKSVDKAFNHNTMSTTETKDNNSFVVEVKISGAFKEHQKGYRYEKQRVTAVIANECSVFGCNKDARAWVYNLKFVPKCVNHAGLAEYEVRYTFDMFAKQLNKYAPEGYEPIIVKSRKPNVIPATREELGLMPEVASKEKTNSFFRNIRDFIGF